MGAWCTRETRWLATLATLGSSGRQPGRGGSGHLRQHGLALGELVGQQDELLIRVFDHAAANQQSEHADVAVDPALSADEEWENALAEDAVPEPLKRRFAAGAQQSTKP